ncbi:MAG: hypothetical protein K8H88_32795, partial [Sandaracinaceae bacterium]|nr:hypothetical protein [Sandaracinaceae bacterium]
ITLASSAFDPILEVTPPGSGTLVNDDWQGDRTRSQIELLARSAGSMKVEVRSYTRDGAGAYQLAVRRVPAQPSTGQNVPVLAAGQNVDGDLGQGDLRLSNGDLVDSFVVRAQGPITVHVAGRGGEAPRTTLVGPGGLTLRAGEGGRYETSAPGNYRLQVIGRERQGYRVEVGASEIVQAAAFDREHHRFDSILAQLRGAQPSGQQQIALQAPIRIGDQVTGSLGASDARLPSGESYDLFALEVAAPAEPITVEMESTALDCFLRVEGPGGQHWENDDFGGGTNSRVEVPLAQAGSYRIVATSYRAGETGAYQLKILTGRDAAVAQQGTPAPQGGTAPATPIAGPQQTIAGSLRPDDRRLQSGEYYDEHAFEWPAGARVHLEARSTDFDTYLIVHPPSGPQQDNDDMTPGQTLNAGLDLQVAQGGRYRVLVTSYRAGMTGDYQLVIGGG